MAATAYREGHGALGCNVVWQGPDGQAAAVHPDDARPDEQRPLARRRSSPDAVGIVDVPRRGVRRPVPDLARRGAQEDRRRAGRRRSGQRPGRGARDPRPRPPSLVPADQRKRGDRGGRRRCATTPCRCAQRISPALDLADLLWEYPVRELVTASEPAQLWVDRKRALFSAWYEFFPRSEGAAGRPGTAARSARHLRHRRQARLPGVAAMGFDVVYLPPIHPIGRVNRKGPQQRPGRRPGRRRLAVGDRRGRGRARRDPPRPGYRGRLPGLHRRRRRAAGLEVAMDLALQCAPDHPWVTEHPEWFTTQPDGSIAYAENPPKKYQDIYPLNFDNDPDGHPRRGPAHRAALGRPGHQGVPGGQPAHQAGELLALADRGGQARSTRTCSSWPRRSPGRP